MINNPFNNTHLNSTFLKRENQIEVAVPMPSLEIMEILEKNSSKICTCIYLYVKSSFPKTQSMNLALALQAHFLGCGMALIAFWKGAHLVHFISNSCDYFRNPAYWHFFLMDCLAPLS